MNDRKKVSEGSFFFLQEKLILRAFLVAFENLIFGDAHSNLNVRNNKTEFIDLEPLRFTTRVKMNAIDEC